MRNVRSVIETPAYTSTNRVYRLINVPYLSDLSPELEEWFSIWGIISTISDALTAHDPLHRPLQRLLI